MKILLLVGLILTNLAFGQEGLQIFPSGDLKSEINCKTPGMMANLDINIRSANLLKSGSEVTLTASGMMITTFVLVATIEEIALDKIVLKLIEKRPDFLNEGEEFTPLILRYEVGIKLLSGELKLMEEGSLKVIQKNRNTYLLDDYNLTHCVGRL